MTHQEEVSATIYDHYSHHLGAFSVREMNACLSAAATHVHVNL